VVFVTAIMAKSVNVLRRASKMRPLIIQDLFKILG